MARHVLTDVQVRKAKRRAKPYRLFDGDGLALWVSPTGMKSWQLRYRLDGKAQTATLGKLERMNLSEARARADALRKLAAKGEHLTAVKHEERAHKAFDARNTFRAVAHLWIEKRRATPWSATHRAQVRASLDNHLSGLYPLRVSQITAAAVAPFLAKVETRAPLMFEKVRARLHRIMDHAVTIGAIERNPLPRPERERRATRRHFPAVTDAKRIGDILRAARASDPCKGIARAHLLIAFTAQRIAEVVAAGWDEFDLDAALWAIPRARMKLKDPARGPHVVPLAPELVATLREWRAADAPDAELVCPAPRDASRPITPEGVEKFYRDVLQLAGQHSPHSWRTTFKTWCGDAGKPRDVSEAQIDHAIGDKTETAYDRAKRLELRRELMHWYEGQLITARDGAEVVKLKRKA